MDTKLKSSKNEKIIGILFVAVVSILFLALFPRFEKEVERNSIQDEAELFENEEFINVLLKSNYVLYKDVVDKSGRSYSSEDLYVEMEEQEVKDKVYAYDYEGEGEILFSLAENVEVIYKEQIEKELESLKERYTDGIAIRMDYCVLDNRTGTVLKNTSKSIEKLLDEQENGEEPYTFYVVLNYDENGRLSAVNVKGESAENLLKKVQLMANSESSLLLDKREETEQYVVADSDTELVEKKVMFRQKKPENVTFVYAMTKEQTETFTNVSVYGDDYLTDLFGSISYDEAFWEAGVGNVFRSFLAAMAIVMIIYTKVRSKENGAITEAKRMLSLEVLIVIGILMISVGSQMAVNAAANSYENYYLEWINDIVPAERMEGSWFYNVLEYIINFCIFSVLFGIWCWCLSQLKDILKDAGNYIRQRSIICRYWKTLCSFVKRKWNKLKEEVLDIDLAKDNKNILIKLIVLNFIILSVFCCFFVMGIGGLVIYSVIVYSLLKKYLYKIQCQYGKLLEATNSIAEGNLNNSFEEDFGLFESYKEELYKIQGGFRKAVDEEVKSQRMKTELITNVSHDLKTPLTAIITYIELLKEENVTEEQRKEYLDTLDRKSMRLKVLIEDLFEVSKANSGNVKIEPVPVDICNLLRQVYLEHEEKMKQAEFDVRFCLPEEKVILQLDSQKTYRIFENLYVNIIKYAMHGTRVYVSAEKKGENGIHIEIKNMSAEEITINPQDLTERFVRGDASRNTEGSGLGLAIAKSFTELQGGKFTVETDGDLFKVMIDW